jgi:hypothetical protein
LFAGIDDAVAAVGIGDEERFGRSGGRAGLRGLQMIQGSVEVEVQVAACALQKSDPPFWHSVPLQAFVVELVELAENSEAAR